MESLLRRSVRFALNLHEAGPGQNGYAGRPPVRGLGRFLEFDLVCAGDPEASSGYLINIKQIDDAVRRHVIPLASEASVDHDPDAAPRLLARSLEALEAALPVAVRAVELHLSPYHAVAMEAISRDRTVVRLRFDFAAAHRLHVPSWTAEENRECFGKCNNPNGHGHNYQLEPCVEVPLGVGEPFDIGALERVVESEVLARFDHKHLNLDTTEFADGTGVNPSVENIARVCFELLRAPVAALGPGVGLRSVRVWETDRTSSEYPG